MKIKIAHDDFVTMKTDFSKLNSGTYNVTDSDLRYRQTIDVEGCIDTHLDYYIFKLKNNFDGYLVCVNKHSGFSDGDWYGKKCANKEQCRVYLAKLSDSDNDDIFNSASIQSVFKK